MPKLTSIVIVTFNQIEYTKRCLESIWRGTDEPYELIVVDNGSSDQTIEYLRGRRNVKLIENTENRGFPAAANQGIAASCGSFILLLNNDVVVPAGWLGRLLRPLRDQADLGLVGPRSNNVSGQQQVAVAYTDLAELDRFGADFAGGHAGEIIEVDRLVGFCLLFRREIIDRIGLLDERFGIGNFEDDDFCRRAKNAGFRAGIAGDAFVHHFGSVTFKGSNIPFGALLQKNRRLFDEKWSAERPRLSLCMIVRDSSKTLAACLASVRGWVDEMIVVDTGSVDSTMEIARSFGARVHQFPWCDSFAAARNESLKRATGEWIFWMDSDDTLDEANGCKLKELVAGALAGTTAYILQVRCPPVADDAYGTETVVDHVKVFRNDEAIRFSGRIHEQVLPSIRRVGGDVQWTDICVVHSGSDVSAEGRERKYQRDLRLLELELSDDPDSTFALFNMGMTLLHSGRAADAVNALCRSLQLASPAESHIRKVYALLAAAYAQLGRPLTGLKTCLQGLTVCPGDPELMFRKGALEQALWRLAEAEKSFRGLIEMVPDRHFSSIDRGIVGIKAWHNLASVHERQGRHDLAAGAWRHVIELDRASATGWHGLLNALSMSRDMSGLEEMIRLEEISEDLRLIAGARLSVLRGEVAKAVAGLEEAMASGASTEVLDELCRLTFTSDLLDAAERWLSELLRRRPNDPSAYLNLGMVQWRLGRFAEAAENVRRSLEIRPNYAAAQDLFDKATKARG